jgi:hypothetical protein
MKYNSSLSVITNKSKYKEYSKINPILRVEDTDLKLIAAELNFLNLYFEPSSKKAICIYIGAAPGNHIPKIAKCYPEITFHCYDANPVQFKASENLQIFLEDFSLETISKYSDKDDIYVITDFVNRDLELIVSGEDQQQRKERIINEDMKLQMEWMKKLKPKVAFLFFRLPHFYKNLTTNNILEYLNGNVYRNIFTPPKTIECRLVVSDFDSVNSYDFERYEKILHYWNDVIRENNLNNPITDDNTPFEEYGNTFDYLMLFWIIKEYFITRGHLHVKKEDILALYRFFRQ